MKVWARSVPLEEYAEQPARPKKPKLKKQSGAKIKHVSTFRILKAGKYVQLNTLRGLATKAQLHFHHSGCRKAA